MSLVRTAVVLGVAVYAVPTDPQKQRELIHTTSDTIVWGVTYCQREPETCRQAGEAIQAAVEKAKFGMALASEVATKWSDQSRDRRQGQGQTQSSTLTIDDLLAKPEDGAVQPPAAQVMADPSVDG